MGPAPRAKTPRPGSWGREGEKKTPRCRADATFLFWEKRTMKPDDDRRECRKSQALSLCRKTAQKRQPLHGRVAQHTCGAHSTPTTRSVQFTEHSIQYRTGYCCSRGGYDMSIPTDCARMRLWLWCGDSIVKPKMCPICVIWCGWGVRVCTSASASASVCE